MSEFASFNEFADLEEGETLEDAAVASVGLVEKEYFSFASEETPFILENKQKLTRIDVAYEAYGTLNAKRNNVILVCHGITGSSHAAGKYAWSNRSVGYWDGLIGPGKVFDTNQYFVIAPNTLGGCRGSTGPSSVNPATGKPYGMSFPIVTIRDMVRVQERFLRECFGIEEVALVTGGSMGGMQALEWAVRFPTQVKNIAPIATCARTGARAMAFNECARKAILLDPDWKRGEYYSDGTHSQGPQAGLALARMISTITFLTDETMHTMFGRRTAESVEESALERDIYARFEVQQYLHDEGEKLVQRFDANTYLYMSRAMDLHDVSRGFASLTEALSKIEARALMMGVSGDDLFPVGQTHEIVERLRQSGKSEVIEHVVESSYGHDAFLTEYRKMLPPLRDFVQNI